MIKVSVYRKSNNEIVYENSGGEECQAKFQDDVSIYDESEFNIVWETLPDENFNSTLRGMKKATIIKRLKNIKNSDLENLDLAKVKKLLKALLDLVVDREELSDEE